VEVSVRERRASRLSRRSLDATRIGRRDAAGRERPRRDDRGRLPTNARWTAYPGPQRPDKQYTASATP